METITVPRVEDGNSQNAVVPQVWHDGQHLPACEENDTKKCAARFHELVDKEFLGTLTPEEKQELEVLTRWRDDQKNAFYRQYV